jgi:hypothetical protein
LGKEIPNVIADSSWFCKKTLEVILRKQKHLVLLLIIQMERIEKGKKPKDDKSEGQRE